MLELVTMWYNVVQCGVVRRDNKVQWGKGGDRWWVGGPSLTYRVGLYMLELVTMWYNVVWYNVVWYNVVWYSVIMRYIRAIEGTGGGLVVHP